MTFLVTNNNKGFYSFTHKYLLLLDRNREVITCYFKRFLATPSPGLWKVSV